VNFLALCQRAIVECGVASNAAVSSVLSTTVGATGSVGRVVNWVGDAWNELQEKHDDWDWMRSSNILGAGVSFATVAGQASYPLGTGAGTVGIATDSFGKWDIGTFRNFTTTVGYINEIFMDDISFDDWRDGYMYGAMRNVQTRPIAIAVGPDQSLNIGPPSDGTYTVTGDYFVAPSVMVNDTDLPVGLPTRFHMIIVYITMMKYAGYESAPEVMQRGSSEYDKMYAQLQAVRAPTLKMGGALA
jgi:hypothetical protein